MWASLEVAQSMERAPEVIVTVDVGLFTLVEGALAVGLIRRGAPPYAGVEALPGGYVHPEEDGSTHAAALRVLDAKVGLEPSYLEQLYTFSGLVRDPRGWSISVAYYALVPSEQLAPAVEAGELRLVAVDEAPKLPFDHDEILAIGVHRLRAKSTYSTLPAFLLAPSFTLSELQEVYEQVIGQSLDRTTFRRQMLDLGAIEPTGQRRRTGASRPAELYRLRGPELREFGRAVRKRT